MMTEQPYSKPSNQRKPKVGVDDQGNEVVIDDPHLADPKGVPAEDEPTEPDISQADFGDPQQEN